MIPATHVEKFQLAPTNKEGIRLKSLADDRWFETFGLFEFGKGLDSKWRRYIPMTVDGFYAFWTAKLAANVFG